MKRTSGVYACHHGVELGFDLFHPESGETPPLVVCLHGGGWISGDRTMMTDVCVDLAQEGFAAAAIDYRLAPLFTFPAAIDDVEAFIHFARSNAETLNFDARRVASFGNSAGGYLALMAGIRSESPLTELRPMEKADLIVDICGITDISNPQVDHLPISWSFIEQFIGAPFPGNENRYIDASPIHHVSAEDPPMMLIHGTDDDIVPISQTYDLAAKLDEYKVPHEVMVLEGEGHSFTFEGWRQLFSASVDFMNRNFQLANR
ncbi:MAG: alpha/beta fold hydrolase [Fimbriimonadaceae bacterium]